MNHPACHICNTPSNFLLRKDGFDEYMCPLCRLSFVYPQPSAEWLKSEVYSYESGYQANKKQDLSLMPEDVVMNRVAHTLVELGAGRKLLDVGCSSGQFLYVARRAGFDGQGVEINKRTADIAKANGFDVYNGFLENAPLARESFDVVFMGDVIEHVNDPRSIVIQCKSLLKPGGIFVISTPNMDCLWSRLTFWYYRLFGIPWSSLTPPHHLFQFSIGNMNRLLGESGFELECNFYSYPPSLRYELGSLHLLKKYKREKTLGSLAFMLFGFGMYTIAYGLNILLRPFPHKDFRMICFYRKERDIQ